MIFLIKIHKYPIMLKMLENKQQSISALSNKDIPSEGIKYIINIEDNYKNYKTPKNHESNLEAHTTVSNQNSSTIAQ
jgi:hypothetical protein